MQDTRLMQLVAVAVCSIRSKGSRITMSDHPWHDVCAVLEGNAQVVIGNPQSNAPCHRQLTHMLHHQAPACTGSHHKDQSIPSSQHKLRSSLKLATAVCDASPLPSVAYSYGQTQYRTDWCTHLDTVAYGINLAFYLIASLFPGCRHIFIGLCILLQCSSGALQLPQQLATLQHQMHQPPICTHNLHMHHLTRKYSSK